MLASHLVTDTDVLIQLLQLIKNHGHLVTRSRRIEVTSDPDDNICRVRRRSVSNPNHLNWRIESKNPA